MAEEGEDVVRRYDNLSDDYQGIAKAEKMLNESLVYFASFPDDKVACPVCSEEFGHLLVLPKVMVCGHSICETCLAKVLKCKKICPVPNCKLYLREKDVADYPWNLLLIEVLKYQDAAQANQQIIFENLTSKTCERFLMKSNEIANSLDVWNDQVLTGTSMIMTLQFWKQELEYARKLIVATNPEAVILSGRKLENKALTELKRLSSQFKHNWEVEITRHGNGSIASYTRYLWTENKATLIAILMNHPGKCWAVRKTNCCEKIRYYQLSGGEGIIHLHNETNLPTDISPFYLPFQDVMNLFEKKNTTAFFQLKYKRPKVPSAPENSAVVEKTSKMYLRLNPTKEGLWNLATALFLGDLGLSYLGVPVNMDTANAEGSLRINPQIMESDSSTKQLINAPSDIRTFRVDRHTNVGYVVGSSDRIFGSINIALDLMRRSESDYLFGKLIVGLDLLSSKLITCASIKDCGLSVPFKA